ncbi:Hypothetical predicted protein, partial [Mytilus galloprovincialis]
SALVTKRFTAKPRRHTIDNGRQRVTIKEKKRRIKFFNLPLDKGSITSGIINSRKFLILNCSNQNTNIIIEGMWEGLEPAEGRLRQLLVIEYVHSDSNHDAISKKN